MVRDCLVCEEPSSCVPEWLLRTDSPAVTAPCYCLPRGAGALDSGLRGVLGRAVYPASLAFSRDPRGASSQALTCRPDVFLDVLPGFGPFLDRPVASRRGAVRAPYAFWVAVLGQWYLLQISPHLIFPFSWRYFFRSRIL